MHYLLICVFLYIGLLRDNNVKLTPFFNLFNMEMYVEAFIMPLDANNYMSK